MTDAIVRARGDLAGLGDLGVLRLHDAAVGLDFEGARGLAEEVAVRGRRSVLLLPCEPQVRLDRHILDGQVQLLPKRCPFGLIASCPAERSCEVKESLGLADNDALWLVLIALEHYDGLYREYPARLAEETRRTLADVQREFAVAAAVETKRAHRKLAEAVASASIKIASKRTDTMRIQGFAAAVGTMVIFGALCLAMGHALGSSRLPPWSHGTGARRVLSAALGAPAGWMLLLLLLPAAGLWARAGWTAARAPLATTKEIAKGCGLVSLVIASVTLLAIAVLRML